MFFFIFFFLNIIVEIANKRGRSSFGWFMLSLFVSPIITAFFLAVLGETDEKREGRIIEEEKIRNRYRNPVNANSVSDLEIWLKENPGKSVNDYYNNR